MSGLGFSQSPKETPFADAEAVVAGLFHWQPPEPCLVQVRLSATLPTPPGNAMTARVAATTTSSGPRSTDASSSDSSPMDSPGLRPHPTGIAAAAASFAPPFALGRFAGSVPWSRRDTLPFPGVAWDRETGPLDGKALRTLRPPEPTRAPRNCCVVTNPKISPDGARGYGDNVKHRLRRPVSTAAVGRSHALARVPGSRLRRRAIDRPAFDDWLRPVDPASRHRHPPASAEPVPGVQRPSCRFLGLGTT
jgi:hypothetical protein